MARLSHCSMVADASLSPSGGRSGRIVGNTEVWGRYVAKQQPQILRRCASQDDSSSFGRERVGMFAARLKSGPVTGHRGSSPVQSWRLTKRLKSCPFTKTVSYQHSTEGVQGAETSRTFWRSLVLAGSFCLRRNFRFAGHTANKWLPILRLPR